MGIVQEKVGIEAKQPNSAIHKYVCVQLTKNGKKMTVFMPRDGCLSHIEAYIGKVVIIRLHIEENHEVLVVGFGRKCHSVGDISGVRFEIVKVANVSLLALYKKKKETRR